MAPPNATLSPAATTVATTPCNNCNEAHRFVLNSRVVAVSRAALINLTERARQ